MHLLKLVSATNTTLASFSKEKKHHIGIVTCSRKHLSNIMAQKSYQSPMYIWVADKKNVLR